MTDFGGMGGCRITLNLEKDYKYDLFAQALNRALGEDMREDEEVCEDVWSALANIDWKHYNGDTAGYSFRAAGDLIAAIRGKGCYMDWYCRSEAEVLKSYIYEALNEEGWEPDYD